MVNGKKVFLQSCSVCHQVGSEGSSFGPALTQIGSKLTKDALYVSILHPDAGSVSLFGSDPDATRRSRVGYLPEERGVYRKMKVLDLLQSVPGLGKVRARQMMERIGIAESRRVRGLGTKQIAALEREFAPGE